MENPKEVIINPKEIENMQQSISPTTFIISEDVSNSEEQGKLVLTEELQETTAKNNILFEKNKRLRQRCRYLKLRNRKLRDTIKKFKLLIGGALNVT